MSRLIAVLVLGQVLDVQQHGVLLRPQLVSYQQMSHQLRAQSCKTRNKTESKREWWPLYRTSVWSISRGDQVSFPKEPKVSKWRISGPTFRDISKRTLFIWPLFLKGSLALLQNHVPTWNDRNRCINKTIHNIQCAQWKQSQADREQLLSVVQLQRGKSVFNVTLQIAALTAKASFFDQLRFWFLKH